MKPVRKIIRIDEEKCDGCGQCAEACAEGAIQIVGGKARLVSETYCDGLGACIGDCPRDAITIEEREAAEFDAEAVKQHLAQESREPAKPKTPLPTAAGRAAIPPNGHVCPGTFAQMLQANRAAQRSAGVSQQPSSPAAASALANWPVQLRLVPVNAPYFEDAELLIAADCAPFALADFHARLLDGKILLIGCPKLDDVEFYRQKLAEIFRQNEIRSVEIAYMEVPCCFGLVQIVRFALAEAGKPIPLVLTKIGIRGSVCESKAVDAGGAKVAAGCR
jgi:Pyruvate/2-oxoacid:ferredoxin oxidoreductase delta subunit